jgi:hypothetical protein
MTKASWEDIPSLEDLKIDWNYEPENSLGRRSSIRLSKNDLIRTLEADQIPVKIISRKFDKNGSLVDLSTKGLAVLLDVEMKAGLLIKVGFFLGKVKVITRGIIRNSSKLRDFYRTGIEFVEFEDEATAFIASLTSSKIYKH